MLQSKCFYPEELWLQCNYGYRVDFDCLPVSVQGGPVRTAMEICRDLKVQMDDPNR
jgi:hypothetical protein